MVQFNKMFKCKRMSTRRREDVKVTKNSGHVFEGWIGSKCVSEDKTRPIPAPGSAPIILRYILTNKYIFSIKERLDL